MAMTNAQRQAAYRQRHLKDLEGLGVRLNTIISGPTSYQLTRLATHYGVTRRATLERVLQEAEANLLNSLSWQKQKAYLDVTR